MCSPVPGGVLNPYIPVAADIAGVSEIYRIGATAGHAFVHAGAAAMPSPFYYRVSRVDPCGQESPLD